MVIKQNLNITSFPFVKPKKIKDKRINHMAKKKVAPKPTIHSLEQKLLAAQELVKDKEAFIERLQDEMTEFIEKNDELEGQLEALNLKMESDKGLPNDPAPEIEDLKSQLRQTTMAVESLSQDKEELITLLKEAEQAPSLSSEKDSDVVNIDKHLVARCLSYPANFSPGSIVKSMPTLVNVAVEAALEIERRTAS